MYRLPYSQNLIAAIFLHHLVWIFRTPIVATIRTNPLLSPIATLNVHIAQPIEVRAWGTVGGFGCMPSSYEAEEDLLRLRRSAIKHSWVLNRGEGVVEHPLLLTMARPQ